MSESIDNPIGDVVAADDYPTDGTGRTWVLRWDGGDSTRMTEDEADQLAHGLKALTDNARLRAQVLAGEWGNKDYACSWCNALKYTGEHKTDCPAFTPSGEVK